MKNKVDEITLDTTTTYGLQTLTMLDKMNDKNQIKPF